MDIQQSKELLQRYLAGKCNDAEMELIENWYRRLIETEEFQWQDGEREIMQEIMEARILKRMAGGEKKEASRGFFVNSRARWAAAASVIFLLGISGFFLVLNKSKHREPLAKAFPVDIKAPESNRAMITLANGQKIYLDSAGNGSLAVQGNVKLVKLEGGSIAYMGQSGEVTGKMEYNTLSNPRGSNVVNVVLADGSKVWLNAASSLTYPVAFPGKERKVSITGEAYFEVKHDASKPFIVNNGSMNISVLGTHFNVNAFKDDGNDTKVTLLEGSVKIDNGTASGFLKPGQQAVVGKEVKITSDVDLDEVMGWKNGYFIFENTDIYSLMREVARWYNVQVIFEEKVTEDGLSGKVSRSVPLPDLIQALELNDIKVATEGRSIIVGNKK